MSEVNKWNICNSCMFSKMDNSSNRHNLTANMKIYINTTIHRKESNNHWFPSVLKHFSSKFYGYDVTSQFEIWLKWFHSINIHIFLNIINLSGYMCCKNYCNIVIFNNILLMNLSANIDSLPLPGRLFYSVQNIYLFVIL